MSEIFLFLPILVSSVYWFIILQDVSDILIGWHIDGSAGQELASFMASSLTTMAPYFSVDSDFSVSLIKQFQEDIASFTAVCMGCVSLCSQTLRAAM